MRVSYAKEKPIIFSDLDIGAAYCNACMNLCIKTSNAEDIDNCLALEGEEWKTYVEDVSSPVIPVDAELVIHN